MLYTLTASHLQLSLKTNDTKRVWPAIYKCVFRTLSKIFDGTFYENGYLKGRKFYMKKMSRKSRKLSSDFY